MVALIEAGVAHVNVPSLAEWAGGLPAIEALTLRFYDKIESDPTLAPIVQHKNPDVRRRRRQGPQAGRDGPRRRSWLRADRCRTAQRLAAPRTARHAVNRLGNQTRSLPRLCLCQGAPGSRHKLINPKDP